MAIRWDTIKVDGKAVKAYAGIPERPGKHPGIVIAHHAPGLDGPIQDFVHRLGREGYAAIAPDLFHRQAEGIDGVERTKLLIDSEIVTDVNAAAAHLVASGKVGPLVVMGFCMGGRVAYLAACANPEFRAAAVFYGGNIMKALGDGPSPFERSAAIACPVIGFFGVEDTNPSQEDVRKIDAELTRLAKWHEFHNYNDAGHAFHNFTNVERYRERAARGSWAELHAFFDRFLKEGAKA